MKFLSITIILLFLSLANITRCFAQIDRLEKGDHVRIEAPTISSTLITGDINEISNQGILLYGSSDEILFSAIERLEVGKIKRRTLRGALIGGASSGLVLGLYSMVTNEPCSSDGFCLFDFTSGEAFLLGAVVGGVPGLLIGGIIGSTIKGVNWKNIRVEMSGQPMAIRYVKRANVPGLTVKWSF